MYVHTSVNIGKGLSGAEAAEQNVSSISKLRTWYQKKIVVYDAEYHPLVAKHFVVR